MRKNNKRFGKFKKTFVLIALIFFMYWGLGSKWVSKTIASNNSVITPIIIQETLYPGSIKGVPRTQDPISVGIPLSDSLGINSVSELGLSGATVGQFRVLSCWQGAPTPLIMATSCGGEGHIKWVLVDTEADIVSPGALNNGVSLTTGSGNFGGSNLATDNGSTITVDTGVGKFLIKKANFDVIDQVVVNGNTLVAPGTSQGMTVLGPSPTAVYPGNVTCLPTNGGTPCTTVYSSANDPNSTCSIEENGPVKAALVCTGHHLDASGHSYMAFTVREYFYYNQTSVKVTSELQNADYGTSNTFASAAKGYQGYELRLTPNLSGNLKYTIANNIAAPTSGSLGATDSIYLYQAESNFYKGGSFGTGSGYVAPSTLSGYAIIKNGTALLTGNGTQYPQGWADISDSSGAGIEIGEPQFAAYGNKSLEFQNGGKDVRVGIWASENNTSSVSVTSPSRPYYLAWPQYSINDVYLNFHSSTPTSMANNFLKMQHYLSARASTTTYYNNTKALFDNILDPNEEDAYYASVAASASPVVVAPTDQDLGTTNYNWPLSAWRYYAWPGGGVSNQSEFRYGHLIDFIQRGFTGGLLDSANFYNMAAGLAFPRSDGFAWRNEPSVQTKYLDFPTAISENASLATQNQIENAQEHAYWWGMPMYYYMTGNETIHDAITDGPEDAYLDTSSSNNLIANGIVWNSRAAGNVLSSVARLSELMKGTGDSNVSAMLAQGQLLWSQQIKPDLCVSGYPSGCRPNISGGSKAIDQRGTSRVRGVTYQWNETIAENGCPGYPDNTQRDFVPFMVGGLIRGLSELGQMEGLSWSDYNMLTDVAYGIDMAAFREMYVDNGSSSWSGNGFIYKEDLDTPNDCSVGNGGAVNDYYYMVQNPNAYWPLFSYRLNYEGDADSALLQRQFDQSLQNVISGGSAIKDELFQYVIGQVIYDFDHPNGSSLVNVHITKVTNNNDGSYTLSWIVPPNTQSYRIKWGTKQIVDWIGFNSGTNTFTGDPAHTMNWFAANDANNIPSPIAADSIQTITINTATTGLVAADFAIKAYVSKAILGFLDTPTPSTTINTSTTYNFGTVTLKNGSTGPVVMELQRFLNQALNLGLVVDGKLGPKTTAVIQEWQKNNGLITDGLVGSKTKAKMNESVQ